MFGATEPLGPALDSMAYRGPDDRGEDRVGEQAVLGHLRLSILDLSPDGHQPMTSADGRYTIVFNGEIYNYLELREELGSSTFRSGSDTEVLLAAYAAWGPGCLDRLIGMFTFIIWDAIEQVAFAARDRFGVKPLYIGRRADGATVLASEIKGIHAAGVPKVVDDGAWATYLAFGVHDDRSRTFWQGVESVPPGHWVRWRDGRVEQQRWYDVADRIGDALDDRPVSVVEDEYLELLLNSVSLRFRADVPVGINLSGGLDSSTLLAAVHAVQGDNSDVKAFTFICDDPYYDELPWVEEMLATTRHALVTALLSPSDVPGMATEIFAIQDEPYGGLPTLAYARLFEVAKQHGVTVLLDGQGMDEQWAGYDYYGGLTHGARPEVVQGVRRSPVRPACLAPEFAASAEPLAATEPFPDPLRNAQYRDIRYTKLQRALRFNDRVSMRSSRELREPFLDHRLVELALRQPPDRKVAEGTGKVLLRRIVADRLPAKVVDAPKRPLQTPQREWLRGPLRVWAEGCIEDGLEALPRWFRPDAVRAEVAEFMDGEGDSSFHVWQWVSAGLLARSGACS